MFAKVSCEGGGKGRAFEKRERPPVLGASMVASIMEYRVTNQQGLGRCAREKHKKNKAKTLVKQ